jgi:hypothetical protein
MNIFLCVPKIFGIGVSLILLSLRGIKADKTYSTSKEYLATFWPLRRTQLV